MNTQQFIVYGRVQGVGFRYFTWREALRLNLNGWVKNQNDGSVAILVQGSLTQLEIFQKWLQQGPKTAQITHIEYFPMGDDKIFTQFQILY